jgi:uncharacterized RDD family membrane protein YckC
MYCGHKLREFTPRQDGSPMATLDYTPSELDEDAPFASDPPPQYIGGYRLLQRLGTGGMGAVYEAAAPDSKLHVAIKLLSPRLASSPSSVERFKQEGRLASQLAHPRCVFVLAADTDEERPYIVMELMPGQTLKDVVEARGPLPWEEAVRHILDVVEGLAEAHRVGMIHRDIKPSNCFLTADGRVKVGDFGLSKSLAETHDKHLTQSGAFLGTVLFASPEQIRGEPLDYGSDVYSVCSTLYYLLCGEAPYHHESVTAALARAISEDAPPLRDKHPSVPRALEQVVMKGLERDRDRRWQSLEDLRDALINLLPSRRYPARPRSLIGAFILDEILLTFLAVPLQIVQQWVQETNDIHVNLGEVDWIDLLLALLYFSLFEGVLGATPGKWLLGLRVSKLGQSTAPGFLRALIRTVVFQFLLLSIAFFPGLILKSLGPVAGGISGGLVFLVAASLLLIQLRKKWRFRGIHDVLSGCQVTQKPLPARKLRLAIKHPTPLHTLPAQLQVDLPKSIGGYSVRGRIAVDPSGEEVWLGEDGSLARLVLIWLRPALPHADLLPEANRPTRLRRLGGGVMTRGKASVEWTAFAAPLGGPLAEAVDSHHRLPWADARFLLEQLVEELRAAEADQTLPERLSLNQVWVEPNGRLQVLDCTPVNGSVDRGQTPLGLLREVASLALEGHARGKPGLIRAPVPPHAEPFLYRLFSEGGYPSLTDLQRDLLETQNHRPEVTSTIRAAQLGIQAAFVSGALSTLFILTFGMRSSSPEQA